MEIICRMRARLRSAGWHGAGIKYWRWIWRFEATHGTAPKYAEKM